MDWKNESMWELRHLEARRKSVVDSKEQVRMIENQMTGLRSATSDATPVSGGGSGREDMLLNLIAEKDAIAATATVVESQIKAVDRALADISEEERHILDMCFVRFRVGNINRLCEELQCEAATVYRRRDAALKEYTIRRRGMLEI